MTILQEMSSLRAARVQELIDNNSPIIEVNRALGRDCIISDEEIEHSGWMDCEVTNLPVFLKETLSLQFRSPKFDKTKDLLLQNFISTSEVRTSALSDLKMHNDAIRDYYKAEVDKGPLMPDGNHNLAFFHAQASLSELAKAQVLSAAPLFGHGLAGGGHPKHKDVIGTFTIPLDFCKEAGSMMRNRMGTARYHDYTVPALTSQGMVLKSKRDTPAFRIYAKALQATLARKCKSRVDYDKCVETIDDVFRSRGYTGVTNDFYLGQRRQGSRKTEVISSDYDYDNTKDYDLALSVAIQGRSRGIFPPSEFLKHFFKPFAEGIKKDLFVKGYSTIVDLDFISAKLHYIMVGCFKDDLFNADHELMPFYDLSAMDTTTHLGFLQSYHAFCEGVFPDFKSVEGNTVESSALIFPANIDGNDFFRQEIKGRSTLSGQPDVTTKNNVCHLLAMSWCLSQVLDEKPIDVFSHLMFGDGKSAKLKQVVAHIHGDDTMIYISGSIEDYKLYYQLLEEQGFATSYEKAPVFLKKTSPLASLPSSEDKLSSIHAECRNLIDSMFAQGISMKDNKMTNKRKVNQFIQSIGNFRVKSDYNVDYMGSLSPIEGSLIKNRFGEYETSEKILVLMALIDTARLMGESAPDCVKSYWSFILRACDRSPDTEDLGSIRTFIDISVENEAYLFDQKNTSAIYPHIQQFIIKLAEGSVTKAKSIRQALERIFYTSGENIEDHMLDSVFGSLFITGSTFEDAFDVGKMSIDELLKLICKIQIDILDTGGSIPELDEHIVKAANSIISKIGKIQ